MKIGNIQNQPYLIEYNNKNKTEKKDNQERNYAPISSNPHYYQALNNVHFGSSKKEDFIYMAYNGKVTLFADLPLSDSREKTPITLDRNIVKKYLSDKNGNVSVENLKMFNSFFEQIMSEKQTDANKTLSKYSKVYDSLEEYREEYDEIAYRVEDNGYINLDALEELEDLVEEKQEQDRKDFENALQEKDFDPDEFEELTIRMTMPIEKEERAQYIENINKEYSFDKMKKDTIDTISIIFLLSKTKNGYDFSDVDKKQELAEELLSIEHECNKTEYDRILAFLEQKAEAKSLDIDLLYNFIDIVNSQGFWPTPLDKIYDMLEKYGDDEKKVELLSFCSDQYGIEIPDFEEFYTCGLNQKTKKYDENLAARFKNVYTNAAKLMDKIYEETSDTSEDCWDRLCYYAPVEITKNYFYMYTDKKTGKLLPNAPSAKDYLESIKSNYEAG